MLPGINRLGAIVLVAALIFTGGWYVGRAQLQKRIAEEQAKQLLKDAKESTKIEARADERERKTDADLSAIKETEWASRPLPGDVVERLRNRGLAP